MRLLVTGGTGFIGSHLAEEGRRRRAEVIAFGLTDRPEEQASAERLRKLGAEVLPGSITDAELCRQSMRGVAHVFYLAVAMREGGKSDEFFESINLDGTRHLLEAASVQRVERFVYCSTIGIYGHFFFQAEDGIRDGRVTGVQTCALPISTVHRRSWRYASSRRRTRRESTLRSRDRRRRPCARVPHRWRCRDSRSLPESTVVRPGPGACPRGHSRFHRRVAMRRALLL